MVLYLSPAHTLIQLGFIRKSAKAMCRLLEIHVDDYVLDEFSSATLILTDPAHFPKPSMHIALSEDFFKISLFYFWII